jgi:hypothetical protein
LDFAFEAPQRAFEGLAILQMDFCQTKFTCLPVWVARVERINPYCTLRGISKVFAR